MLHLFEFLFEQIKLLLIINRIVRSAFSYVSESNNRASFRQRERAHEFRDLLRSFTCSRNTFILLFPTATPGWQYGRVENYFAYHLKGSKIDPYHLKGSKIDPWRKAREHKGLNKSSLSHPRYSLRDLPRGFTNSSR